MWIIDKSFARVALVAVSIAGLSLQLGCSDKHRSRIVAPNPIPSWHYAGDWAYDMTPTATRLLYRHLPSVDALGGVYMMDLESPDLAPTLLFPDSLPYFTNDCRLSPDLTKIAYTRDALQDIWVRNLTDGSDEQVTFTFGNARAPDWDPSGRYVIYMRVMLTYGMPDSVGGIHLVDTADLSDRAFRVQDQLVFGDTPTWSPDSIWIAYAMMTRVDERTPWHIYAARADGSSSIDLTPGSTRQNKYPHWLGNGGEILFESYGKGGALDHETCAVRVDGSGLRTLPVDIMPGVQYAAIARTAGQYVYTDGDTGSNFGVLFLRRLDDGRGTSIRQLTTFKPLPEWVNLSGSPTAQY